jgi:hypothetical protein
MKKMMKMWSSSAEMMMKSILWGVLMKMVSEGRGCSGEEHVEVLDEGEGYLVFWLFISYIIFWKAATH